MKLCIKTKEKLRKSMTKILRKNEMDKFKLQSLQQQQQQQQTKRISISIQQIQKQKSIELIPILIYIHNLFSQASKRKKKS